MPSPPPPFPVAHLRAAGVAYRTAGGQGLSALECLEAAEAAYLAAGGDADDTRGTVLAMIAHLAREHGDWLFGPAQEWIDRHRVEAPAHRDLFERPEDVG